MFVHESVPSAETCGVNVAPSLELIITAPVMSCAETLWWAVSNEPMMNVHLSSGVKPMVGNTSVPETTAATCSGSLPLAAL